MSLEVCVIFLTFSCSSVAVLASVSSNHSGTFFFLISGVSAFHSISMALKSGVFACLILASSLSCTVMAQRHTGLWSENVGKDSVTTTSEPDQNTLNVQIEKLQAWNFSKYASCAVRQRPASMGELPIREEEYVVLAERALKIWYAAILAQPMKKQKLDISIHFWQFCLFTLFGLVFQVGFWCQKLCLGAKT